MDQQWSNAFDQRHGGPAGLAKLLEVDYPLRHDPKEKPIAYGTAGFRTKGHLLAPVVARVSALVVFRSVAGGVTPKLPVGVVITASHNAHEDNGLKLVEPEGGMLEELWESVAFRLGNSASVADFKDACWYAEVVAKKAGLTIGVNTTPAVDENKMTLATAEATSSSGIHVHVGRDTRSTGPELLTALKRGVGHFGGSVVDHGIVSTPVVHDIVYRLAKERHFPNTNTTSRSSSSIQALAEEDHQPGTAPNYYRSMVDSFTEFHGALQRWKVHQKKDHLAEGNTRHFVVDCANGVGTITCHEVIRRLDLLKASGGNSVGPPVEFHLLNTDIADTTKLNENCGADLLQKTRKITPELLAKRKELLLERDSTISSDDIALYSLDGDADRIVGFYVPAECGPDAKIDDAELLDGDRIIVILATLMQRLLQAAQLAPKVGVVQTAYANGASTHYIANSLGLPPKCAATGVKHTHHLAAQMDVGIYFEANGHGTVLFDQLRFMPKIKALMRSALGGFSSAAALKDDSGAEVTTADEEVPEPETPASPVPLQRHDAAKFIYLLSELVSQACGDAVADLLAIETALSCMDWTFKDWFQAYDDLPSVQIKVSLGADFKGSPSDLVKNTPDQTRVTEPAALQTEIDRLVELHGGPELLCRSFVRPSGTEPIVRVYAEASTKGAMEGLGSEVVDAVKKILLA